MIDAGKLYLAILESIANTAKLRDADIPRTVLDEMARNAAAVVLIELPEVGDS